MKKVNFLAILAVSFGLTMLGSCTSDLTSGADASITATATDGDQMASINDEVVSSADDYVNAIDASGYMAVSSNFENSGTQRAPITKNIDGVIITIDNAGNVYPKNICIDFGTTGITAKRGNILKGKIYITVSNKMSIANSTRTITYSNFFVNDNQVMGTKTVVYNGETLGKPSWTTTAVDTILRADGKKITFSSTRTRTRTDNNGTPLIYWDDTYSITGSSTGVNAKGVAYTMVIDETKPLVSVGGFKYFVSGSVIITSENRSAVLDYGDGARDNKATITVNGVTKNITLKK